MKWWIVACLTLVKLPLNALHLSLVATHPVDSLCAQTWKRVQKQRESINFAVVDVDLVARQGYTLDWMPVHRRQSHSLTPRGNLEKPIPILACFLNRWRNLRIWQKPTLTCGEQAKLHTDRNRSSVTELRPWSYQVLPIAQKKPLGRAKPKCMKLNLF